MTIIIFPVHRTRQTERQKAQRITPLDLMFMPARIWVGYCYWWADVLLDAKARPTESAPQAASRPAER